MTAAICIKFDDCFNFVKENYDLNIMKLGMLERQAKIRDLMKDKFEGLRNPELFVGVLMYLGHVKTSLWKDYDDMLLDWGYVDFVEVCNDETHCACGKNIHKYHTIKCKRNDQIAIIGTSCIEKVWEHDDMTVNFNEQVIAECKFNKKPVPQGRCNFCRHPLQISKAGNVYCPCKYINREDMVIYRGKRYLQRQCKRCYQTMRLPPKEKYKTKCKKCHLRLLTSP